MYKFNTVVMGLEDANRKEQLLEQLMNDYGIDVLRTAFFFVKSRTIADDIYQDVFIKVYNKLHTYNGTSNIKTWILQITINQCKDFLKSTWFKRMINGLIVNIDIENEIILDCSPENCFIQKEEKVELFNSILKLPLQMREVLILCFYHSLTEKEISTILKIPQGTVRSRLHRAKTTLKKQISHGEE